VQATIVTHLPFYSHQGETTLREIAMFIRNKGFSKVDLREEDVHSIVNTLVYDGRVDPVSVGRAVDPRETRM